jgi:two-component system, cell cycle sensor histidine kinase and response regulator CckA
MERMFNRLVGSDVELTFSPTRGLGRAKADQSQIEQVLMNLVVNARQAMPRGGKLTIETRNADIGEDYSSLHDGVAPGPYVMFAVSDNGVGMSPQTMSRVFEPFFTTKAMGEGTGLGLSTVFGIVKQSGGHIAVRSEAGLGTTFEVYLPRTTASVHAPEAPPPEPEGQRGTETILVVEDEPQVRALVRGILRRQGYQVLEAASPGEALLLSEQHRGRIDLLLSDVVLPHMSGPRLADRLVALRPDLRLLFMSGYADDSMMQQGILEWDVAFLQKPITVAVLTRKVREVLAARPRTTNPGSATDDGFTGR